MPRYFFDIHDCNVSTIDEDGQDCADRKAVSEHALRILCDIARGESPAHQHSQLGAVVRDDANHVVLNATVVLSTTWVGEA